MCVFCSVVYIFIASNYGRQVFVSTVRQRRGRQLLKCVDPEHIHTPPPPSRRAICFRSPPPWNFHSRKCLSYHPPPPTHTHTPWKFRNFSTWLGTSGKNICVRNIVALHYYTKDNLFGAKMRKIFSCMLLAECILKTNYPSQADNSSLV